MPKLLIHAKCEPYPTLKNIDASWSAEEVITKNPNKMSSKLTMQLYSISMLPSNYIFLRILPLSIFSNMLKSNNFVLDNITALEMGFLLDIKYNKTLPDHIKDVMITQ